VIDFNKLNGLRDELSTTQSLLGSSAERCRYDLRARANELEAKIQQEERLIVAQIHKFLDFVEKNPRLLNRLKALLDHTEPGRKSVTTSDPHPN
jgi:hypothetical protein